MLQGKFVTRVAVNVADIRAKPKFKSERLTQAVFNEKLEILESGDEYSLVRLPDGYEGYINNRFMAEDYDQGEANYLISSVYAEATDGSSGNPRVLTLLPFASQIHAVDHDDSRLRINSPRYGALLIDKCNAIPLERIPRLVSGKVQLLLDNLFKFLGVPYLWGGKSFFGFDCSGFVQINFAFFGLKLPRDTKDQIKMGTEIDRKDIKPGDLLFFKRHVGVAVSEDEYIHSSVSENGVHINSLNAKKPNYLKSRSIGLKAVRRIIED